MSKRAAPSAHDVARLAGVSQAAVSRAFTPGASIAKDTQEKVFRAAKSIGYRPNLHARSLIKGESGIVGTVIGSPQNAIFMTALGALSKGLSKAGKHLLVSAAEGHPTADAHIKDLLNYRVDALLLMSANMSSKLADQCCREGIPVISFNRGSRKVNEFINIISDDRAGARHIAGHLLEQGYRRLGFIAGHPDSPVSRDRESAFTAYLTSHGMSAPAREVGYFRREGALQAARNLLSAKPRPDAIFCANDYMAFAALEVARYEFGLDIGREIGIAGFDDIRESSWPSFDLTTYSLAIVEMIEKALGIVLATPFPKTPFRTVVDGEFKPRGSTRRGRRPDA
jgi:DNA-binding LacI/PurR family transcriptional regulator